MKAELQKVADHLNEAYRELSGALIAAPAGPVSDAIKDAYHAVQTAYRVVETEFQNG